MRSALHGSITAIVTPFKNDADRTIDWDAFDALIEWQIASGTHGIVVCGTTGESPTLDPSEHAGIVERAVRAVKRRILLIAGTGSNCTRKTIEMTRHAEKAGADAALIVTPYYNKPTQEGLYQHYKAVAEQSEIPMIIYNIPGRSIVDMLPETMARVRGEYPSVIAVKDATGKLERVAQTRAACGADFIQLSGEDALIVDFLREGGHGCISVTSNVAPDLCAALHNAWAKGDRDEAARIGEQLMPLHAALFSETSPQPAKYALSRLGRTTDALRLPLVPASETARAAVDAALGACAIKQAA